jgi:hypothetical protein
VTAANWLDIAVSAWPSALDRQREASRRLGESGSGPDHLGERRARKRDLRVSAIGIAHHASRECSSMSLARIGRTRGSPVSPRAESGLLAIK